MRTELKNDITVLLRRATKGDKTAEAELFTVMYAELRLLAGRHMRAEWDPGTLQTTALVHEAYLKLIQLRKIDWQNRAHFFAIAARVMRRVLINRARRRKAQKRDGLLERVDLEEAASLRCDNPELLLALNSALDGLREKSDRACQVVEMKFFGGLTFEEIAIVLGVSAKTVKRDWEAAKAWLYREIYGNPSLPQ